MDAQLFDAAWHRWGRAEQHQAALVEVWNSYIETHPYDFHLDLIDDGVYVARVSAMEPTPPAFEVVLGEWLYNLRTALDYVIWATAAHVSGQLPPPDESMLQYPIYDTEEAWKRNSRRLRSLAPHHREMLRTMQPFASDRDANYLGWLNRLARIDRHRQLVAGTARLAEFEPVVQVPADCGITMEWGDRVLINGSADIARITVRPWTPDTTVSMNPRAGIDPEIAEWSSSPFWRRIRFSERIRMIHIFVAGEIAAYEYDCTGHSRKAALVTDSFKQEADGRGMRRHVRRPRRPETAWVRADPPARSTQERFAGQDFPSGAAPADRCTGH